MSKQFADLHLYNIFTFGQNNPLEFIKRAFELGYKYIAFVHFNKVSKELIKEYKRLCADYGIDYVIRVDLEISNNIPRIKRFLRKYRKDYEIIVARPRSIEAARFSARDRRIDVIYFDDKAPKFDSIQAKVMKENEKFLELTFRELLCKEIRERTIKKYLRIINLAVENKLKIIVSSGARCINEMRSPRDLAACFTILFKIPVNKPYELTSENPISLIEKNRFKLSRNFIMPGIEILGKSEKYEVKEEILNRISISSKDNIKE